MTPLTFDELDQQCCDLMRTVPYVATSDFREAARQGVTCRHLACTRPGYPYAEQWAELVRILTAMREAQPCPECTGAEDCHQIGCQQPTAVK